MGNEIFQTVTGATGLPQELVERELAETLKSKGITIDKVTLEDLRQVLADYLRETILHAKDKFANGVWIEETNPYDELGQE